MIMRTTCPSLIICSILIFIKKPVNGGTPARFNKSKGRFRFLIRIGAVEIEYRAKYVRAVK